MGQYYRAVSIDAMSCVKSYDFDSGAKLMEHSWMKNNFVKFVESLIAKDGIWFGHRLVWAGDYADPEKDENGNDIIEKDEDGNEYIANLYDMTGKNIVQPLQRLYLPHFRYIINETQKTFVDKNKCPKDNDGWRIHPLPLLTCDGNGRGGGDFRGENIFVGLWARDVITVSTRKPKKSYTEIIPNFIED